MNGRALMEAGDLSDSGDLTELGIALHRRMLERHSNVVPAQVADAFLLPLVKALERRFRDLSDQHEIEEEAARSLLNYFNEPKKFKADRGSLLNYLYMDASANLKDIHRRREKVVLHSVPFDEYVMNDAVEGNRLRPTTADEDSSRVDRVLARLSDPVDQEVLRLIMEGERNTEVFVTLLGLEHLSKAEQAAAVQRHKDRVKKTVRRHLERHERGWLKSTLSRFRRRGR
jgi:DNA-directed RNA polymerase specialized sigma24 family protein